MKIVSNRGRKSNKEGEREKGEHRRKKERKEVSGNKHMGINWLQ